MGFISKIFNIFKKKHKLKFNDFNQSMLNVKDFNTWFNKPNKSSYANPGIFLRTDKLGTSFINDYLYEQHNVNPNEVPFTEIYFFERDIRTDWLLRKNKK